MYCEKFLSFTKSKNLFTCMLASDIKYKLLDFFFEEYEYSTHMSQWVKNEYSNKCDTFQNLLELNHEIYTLLRKYFLSRSMFTWSQILKCNDEERKCIKQIIFD